MLTVSSLDDLDFISLKGKDTNLIFSILKKEICLEHGIDIKELTCTEDNVASIRTRKRELVTARQQLMVFLKKYGCCASLAIIGATVCPEKPFDHATVLHAQKTVRNLFETDKAYRKKFLQIKASVDYVFVTNDLSPIEINTVRTPVGYKFTHRIEEQIGDEIRVTLVFGKNTPVELDSDQTSNKNQVLNELFEGKSNPEIITEITEIRA